MDIDAVFLPVAEELIDQVFPTPIQYLQTENPIYDPMTGQTAPQVVTYSINAGILSRGRVRGQGGIAEETMSCGCGSTMVLLVCLCCQRPAIASITTTCTGRFTRSTPRIAATI